ncbi:MAG TPA: hypothetical protein DF383_08920, partial [Deltaproteobacteria bacterium]|nr:hypothetical protein [Deltaproteobacteria bacterium]
CGSGKKYKKCHGA